MTDTGIKVTLEGRHYLGTPLGIDTFVEQFVSNKVDNWADEIMQLSTIAATQPHAAYAALTHGIAGKWTYMYPTRTIGGISPLLQPLETAI